MKISVRIWNVLYSCSSTGRHVDTISIPQPSGPTMADGRPVSLDTLPETFQIVFVGAGSLLADLQRQLIARAGIDALEFRALPVVRRAAIKSVMEHRVYIATYSCDG
eukprot:SAG25_NODE_194_length_12183_cov_70.943893_1_plen_107_part_00